MSAAITVENLGKAYRIGLKDEVPDTLAGAMVSWAKTPLRNFRRLSRLNTFASNGDTDDIVWALRNVSFEVREGEVIGIIGRNGAGKSTLLKILSRITEPTAGRAVIRGRVSSLLEVGTGFHPELSGRENIYMNGTILGMTKREIDRKFDEIVEFSGIERFLDTPIKRYSSGMKVRLAFSVAAHLEPEILIIDEVLAVGDVEFQKKCLGKMHDVASHGRTVLFVSHNMAAVGMLCQSALLLRDGLLDGVGETEQMIRRYMSDVSASGSAEFDLSSCLRPGNHPPIFRSARFYDASHQPRASFAPGEPICIELDLAFPEPTRSPAIGVAVYNTLGHRIATIGTFLSTATLPSVEGRVTVRCDIPGLPFAPGTYPLSMSIGRPPFLDHLEHCVAVEIAPTDFFGNGRLPSAELGHTMVRSEWSLVERGDSPAKSPMRRAAQGLSRGEKVAFAAHEVPLEGMHRLNGDS